MRAIANINANLKTRALGFKVVAPLFSPTNSSSKLGPAGLRYNEKGARLVRLCRRRAVDCLKISVSYWDAVSYFAAGAGEDFVFGTSLGELFAVVEAALAVASAAPSSTP
jgi:hypothetical protein